MSDPLDDIEMGLQQEILGKMAPWQKVLDNASSIFKEGSDVARSGISANYMGIPELGGKAGTFVGEKIMGPLPETGKYSQETYENMVGNQGSGVGSAIGAGIGSLGQLAVNTPKTIKGAINALETGKVSKIQKAFFPWVKKHSAEYGQSLKSGIKNMLTKGKLGVTKAEAEAIFDPILSATEAQRSSLPKKVLDVAERISSKKGNVGIREILAENARLKRGVTSGERVGRVLTERGGIVKKVGENVNQYVKKNVPLKNGQKYLTFINLHKESKD